MPGEIEYMRKYMSKKWMLKYYMSKFLMRHREKVCLFYVILMILSVIILNFILLHRSA